MAKTTATSTQLHKWRQTSVSVIMSHDNECKGYLCKTRTDGSAQCIGDQTTGNLECDGNADCQGATLLF